jgi:predicted PurR-regulated permease PerM
MKKTALCIMTICLSLTFLPQKTNAATTAASALVNYSDSAEAGKLLLRLNEINNMDKTDLDATEKKALKKEVASLQSGLKAVGNGVYLSVGAIIIIILLLILLT